MYTQEIINGILLIFCIYLLVRVKENKKDTEFNREISGNYIGDIYKTLDELKMSDNKSLKQDHGEDIINMIVSIADAISLESYGNRIKSRYTDNVSLSTCRFQAGIKFDAKINAAFKKLGDSRIDHLIKTSPNLFLRRFNTEMIEISRATSAGEETIKGILCEVNQSPEGEMLFKIVYASGDTSKCIDVKHSEIINFKTKP
jgi:hypothetical protein